MNHKKFITSSIVVIVTCGFLVYLWITPYLAIDHLRQAVLKGNIETIEESIDFSTFRDSVRTELRKVLDKSFDSAFVDEENLFSVVGGGLMKKMTESLITIIIDKYVTPEGVASAFSKENTIDHENNSEGKSEQKPSSILAFKKDFLNEEIDMQYIHLNKFVLSDAEGIFLIIFKRDHIFGDWRLSEVELGDAADAIIDASIDADIADRKKVKEAEENALKEALEIGPPNPYGKWFVRNRIDPFDDSKSISAVLFSENSSSYRPGFVTIRCEKNRTQAFIDWGVSHYAGYDVHLYSVGIRFGDEDPVTKEWGLSTNGEANFHPQSIKFAKAIISKSAGGSSKMVARVTRKDQEKVTLVFDITNAEHAIRPVRQACNW